MYNPQSEARNQIESPRLAAAREAPIKETLEELDQGLSLLGDVINRLETRLEPITGAMPGSPDKQPNSSPAGSSALANRLSSMSNSVSSMRRRLSTMLESIEL